MLERKLNKNSIFSLFDEAYTRPDERVMMRLNILIDTHLHEGRNMSFYADALNMKLKPLDSRVKRRYGLSLWNYLAQKRDKLAYRLLQATDLPMKEISAKIGFAEQSCFTRSFKARVGCSPEAYREKFRVKELNEYNYEKSV